MNRITRLATIALSLAAAGSAFAESPTVNIGAPFASNLSRAEVVTQVLQASRAGTLPRNDAELYMVAVAPSNRSRDDVRAETLAAIASGELQALHAEIGDSAQPFASTKRATVITQMASASR